MLVLSRKLGERIVVGDNIQIVVNRITGNRVSIGIEAPDNVKIIRGELKPFADEFEVERDETTPIPPTIEFDSSAFIPRVAR